MTDTVDITGTVASVNVNGAQVYPAGPTPPIPPTPPSGGGLYKPTSLQDLVTQLTKVCTGGGYLIIDPSTPAFTVTAPIVIPVAYTGGAPFGCDFSNLNLSWNGGLNTTKDVITFDTSKAPAGSPIRGFVLKNLYVFGNGYIGQQCGRGVVINAPGGGRPIYKGIFDNLSVQYCGLEGIRFCGDVFEAALYNMISENNYGDGMVISDVPTNGGSNGVISNLMMYGTNLSRNRGYGLNLPDQANSVDMFGGSFINNAFGGIFANTGIRTVMGVNGENTGLSLINIPGSSFGSNLSGCNMSSDGQTKAPGGKVSQYVLNSGGSMNKIQNSNAWVTPYGSGSQPAMAINAPGGTPWK